MKRLQSTSGIRSISPYRYHSPLRHMGRSASHSRLNRMHQRRHRSPFNTMQRYRSRSPMLRHRSRSHRRHFGRHRSPFMSVSFGGGRGRDFRSRPTLNYPGRYGQRFSPNRISTFGRDSLYDF